MPLPLAAAALHAGNQIIGAVSSLFEKERLMGANAAKVALGLGFPIEPTGLFTIVVSSFADPGKIELLLALYGMRTVPPDDDFFQHSDMVEDDPDAMMGLLNRHNEAKPNSFSTSTAAAIWSSQVGLNVGDILQMYNREQLTWQASTWYLHRLGIRDEGTQKLIMSQRNEIPPVSDLIRFAVRDAFTPEIVAKYGFAEGYPAEINKYISWQGLGWKPGTLSPGGVQADGVVVGPHEATWGEISWFAHWDLPSPSQGYDMYHMLYADSRFGASPWVLNADGEIIESLPFGGGDLEQLLKTADYPEYFRKRMIATSNPPLTRVDTRRMYALGIIGEADVYHQFRAGGYSDANAWSLTQYTKKDVLPDVSPQVCKLFKSGVINEADAVEMLTRGKLSQLQSESVITKCKLDTITDRIIQITSSARHGVLHGAVTIDEGIAVLSQLGLDNVKLAQLQQQWELERRFNERLPALRNILVWYIDGTISRDDFIGRLQRLNYSDSSISAYVKNADKKITQTLAREGANQAKAQQKADSDTIKATERQQRQIAAKMKVAAQAVVARNKVLAQAADDRVAAIEAATLDQQAAFKAESEALADLQRSYAAASSDGNLKAYWKAGQITLDEVRVRLASRRFVEEDIERWIDTHLGG